MMHSSTTEIPFEKTASGLFIPWIIALMVYLSTIVLGGAVLIYRYAEQEKKQIEYFALEFPDFPIKTVRGTPLRAEVRFILSQPQEVSRLHTDLQNFFPQAKIKTKENLSSSFSSNILEYFLLLSLGIASFIAIISVFTIIFITHTGLAIHHHIITILKLMGAENDFIARQFQYYSLKTALKGGTIGSLLAGSTVLFLQYKMQASEIFSLLFKNITIELWSIIVLIPVLMSFIVIIVARMTVLFTLDKE